MEIVIEDCPPLFDVNLDEAAAASASTAAAAAATASTASNTAEISRAALEHAAIVLALVPAYALSLRRGAHAGGMSMNSSSSGSTSATTTAADDNDADSSITSGAAAASSIASPLEVVAQYAVWAATSSGLIFSRSCSGNEDRALAVSAGGVPFGVSSYVRVSVEGANSDDGSARRLVTVGLAVRCSRSPNPSDGGDSSAYQHDPPAESDLCAPSPPVCALRWARGSSSSALGGGSSGEEGKGEPREGAQTATSAHSFWLHDDVDGASTHSRIGGVVRVCGFPQKRVAPAEAEVEADGEGGSQGRAASASSQVEVGGGDGDGLLLIVLLGGAGGGAGRSSVSSMEGTVLTLVPRVHTAFCS